MILHDEYEITILNLKTLSDRKKKSLRSTRPAWTPLFFN
jgi:hypothetical protein